MNYFKFKSFGSIILRGKEDSKIPPKSVLAPLQKDREFGDEKYLF